ncbi:MAG: hypothetical protein WBQ34_05205 [Candidatus Acidiferrales bacterium]
MSKAASVAANMGQWRLRLKSHVRKSDGRDYEDGVSNPKVQPRQNLPSAPQFVALPPIPITVDCEQRDCKQDNEFPLVAAGKIEAAQAADFPLK